MYRTPKSKCELSGVRGGRTGRSLCYWRFAYTCSNFIARRLIGCKASRRSWMITNDYQLYIISRHRRVIGPLALRRGTFGWHFCRDSPPSFPYHPRRLRARSWEETRSRGEISVLAVRCKFRAARRNLKSSYTLLYSRAKSDCAGLRAEGGRVERGRPIAVRYGLSYSAGLNWMQKELETSVGATGPSFERDLAASGDGGTAAAFCFRSLPRPLLPRFDPSSP